MTRSTTSQTLLAQAQAGKESAWRELQALYSPLGYYWCRQQGLAPRDAEEIWANVLGRVAEKLGQFEHNGRKGAFRKWLKTITRNEVADFQRSRSPTLDEQQLSVLQNVEATAEDEAATEVNILYRRAWELIQQEFSEEHQSIFRRVVEHAEQPQDVAKDLGLVRASIYTVVFRIRKRLRERFGPELEES